MNNLKITLIISLLPCLLSAQNYLSKERETEIKTSGRYYWEECADFDADNAKGCALSNLTNLIIADAVNLSRKQDEVLDELKINAHFDNLQQEGQVEILAWIARDSVFVITKKTAPQPIVSPPAPEQESNPVATDNSVLQELVACKNYKEMKRVATINGLITGEINSTKGFINPEKCIIAVFATDGTLTALLDAGGSSRTDLLSGKTVQNPEQHYKGSEYNLWYLQQKK